jgi:dCTP deaminase
MIFTDKTIISEMQKGYIVVHPFERRMLGTNSIDLTLNPKILIYQNAMNYIEDIECHNRFGKWDKPFSEKVLDCKQENKTVEREIPEYGFVLMPGQLYIASTNEYTETYNAVPVLEGKSSLARLGLFVHVTAGFGDVGFKGTWTLELVATVPLRIYPNMKICQISYHGISEQPLISYDKKEDAKYSGQIGATASKMEENFINK